jgi:hypothetical protein
MSEELQRSHSISESLNHPRPLSKRDALPGLRFTASS